MYGIVFIIHLPKRTDSLTPVSRTSDFVFGLDLLALFLGQVEPRPVLAFIVQFCPFCFECIFKPASVIRSLSNFGAWPELVCLVYTVLLLLVLPGHSYPRLLRELPVALAFFPGNYRN